MKILSSATKIVLLLLVVGLIVMNFLQIDVSDTYKITITAVISFYFGQKAVETQSWMDTAIK